MKAQETGMAKTKRWFSRNYGMIFIGESPRAVLELVESYERTIPNQRAQSIVPRPCIEEA